MIENALSGKVCNQKAKSVIIFSASEYTLITNLQPSKNAEIPTEKENGSDFSLPLNFGGGQRSRPALAPPLAFVSLRCPDLHSG